MNDDLINKTEAIPLGNEPSESEIPTEWTIDPIAHEDVDSWAPEELPSVIESLLFASVEPLSSERLSEIIEVDLNLVETALGSLKEKFIQEARGIELVKVAQKFQLRTNLRYSGVITKMKALKPRKLSNAALETLAIVAHRQPIVKSEIERLRGVESTPALKTLLERQLITVLGYQATVGQPSLYGTTETFLTTFGLNALDDLPSLREARHFGSDPGEGDDATSEVSPIMEEQV
jgi:segregation and condensation protein B